jgi:hypothetical protein
MVHGNLREKLRENRPARTGSLRRALRENREVAEAGVMVLDSGVLIQDRLLDSRPA